MLESLRLELERARRCSGMRQFVGAVLSCESIQFSSVQFHSCESIQLIVERVFS